MANVIKTDAVKMERISVSNWTETPGNHDEWAMSTIQQAHFNTFNAMEAALKPASVKKLRKALLTLENAFHHLRAHNAPVFSHKWEQPA